MKVHYDYYKTTYADKATLHFTDTDSLIYKIQTENPLLDMINAPEWLTFDIAAALSPQALAELAGGDEEKMKELYEKYKKVKGQLGGMKLETARAAMSEFVGLVAKLYSYQTVDEDGELSSSIKG